jgi:hypothetical protein
MTDIDWEEAARRNLADYRTAQAQLDVLREHLAAGTASDGHHTHNELYQYRMLYNALALHGFTAVGWEVTRSWRHHSGEECFGGGWFVVQADTPAGQVTNHYQADHWYLFEGIPDVETSPAWDGHTPPIAAQRLEAAITFLRQAFAEKRNRADLMRRAYARVIRERDMQAGPGLTLHINALSQVAGASMHLVQQWAETSDDGRNHLLSNLAKSLDKLEYVEAKLGIAIDEYPKGGE